MRALAIVPLLMILAGAADEPQLYVMRPIFCGHGPSCPMVKKHRRMAMEKAWVVAPGVVITSPRPDDDSPWASDGMLTTGNEKDPGRPARWISHDPLWAFNAFAIGEDVPVSKDIPKPIREAWPPLLEWITAQGGLDAVIGTEDMI